MIKLKNYEFIDAGRGYAIFGVVIVHSSQKIGGLAIPIKTIASIGQMGVQLFFVLSALTLCLSWSSKGGGLQKFFIRRFFRIAPLYYVGIILYGFLSIIFDKGVNNYSLSNILSNVCFVHGFVPAANNCVVPGGWSIGTEMAFYALFPFLFRWLFANERYFEVKWGGLIFLSFGFVMIVSAFFGWPGNFTFYNLGSQLPVFLIGILLWDLKFKNDVISRLSNNKLFVVSAFLFLGSCYFFVYLRSWPFQLFFGIAFLFFIELISRFSFLRPQFICVLGQRSYSIYLFHFLFAHWMAGAIDGIWPQFVVPMMRFLLVAAVSLFASSWVASITMISIEKRGQRIGRMLERKAT